MKTFNNIPVNWLTIFGTFVIISLFVSIFFTVINKFFPVKIEDTLTVSTFQQINQARYDYEDSVAVLERLALNDTIYKLMSQKHYNDSIINNFYNFRNNYYENKIDSINYMSSNDLVIQLELRYRNR